MFQFEIVYDSLASRTLLPKKQVVIKYGLIKSSEYSLLGTEVTSYKDRQWSSKISIDMSVFNDHINGLWIQLHNQMIDTNITDIIAIDKNIISREKYPFLWSIELTPNVRFNRIKDPYCLTYNIFPQQYRTSLDIISHINDGYKHIVMVSQMQMGKTGCAKSVAYNLTHLSGYPQKKLFFICGMNDNNLLNQAKSEFKGLIPEDNILFSKKLQKILSNSSNNFSLSSTNFAHTIIFIDESHYASQQDSVVYKFLKNIVGVTADGYTKSWNNNDVVIISISATPMAEIANLDQPQSDKRMVVMHPGDDYYGVIDMSEKNLIKQSHNLNKDTEIDKLIDIIKESHKQQSHSQVFKYGLIRLGSVFSKDKLETIIKQKVSTHIQFINYYSGSTGSTLIDFNQIVDHKPSHMTIIWIYDSLRAGKQLNTENISFVHDSHCCAPDVAAQGLAGRLCGYGKVNHNVTCYTNLKSITKFIDWIKHYYDFGRIPSGSKDIINGFDVNSQSHWQKNIPIMFKMTQDLISYCIQYRLEHGKNKYNNEFKKYCKENIINSNQNQPLLINILNDYYPSKNGGFMIIDNLNKPKSVDKHWESNYNSAINNKSTQGFVTPSTKPRYNKLYYIFLNLIPQHKSFGYGLVCYKEYIDDLSHKRSQVSTKITNIHNPFAWGHPDGKISVKPKIAIKKKITLKPQIKLKLKLKPNL